MYNKASPKHKWCFHHPNVPSSKPLCRHVLLRNVTFDLDSPTIQGKSVRNLYIKWWTFTWLLDKCPVLSVLLCLNQYFTVWNEIWLIRWKEHYILCMEHLFTEKLARSRFNFFIAFSIGHHGTGVPKEYIPNHSDNFAWSSLLLNFKSLFFSRALRDFRRLRVAFFNTQVVYF